MKDVTVLTMSHRRKAGAAMLIGTFLLCTPAVAAEGCALWVENGRVCFALGHADGCVALSPNMNEDFEHYRCLMREREKIAGCNSVVVAPNTLITFKPPKLAYRALIYPDRSKKFFSEEQIQRSCSPR
jgi:hypothetical protein